MKKTSKKRRKLLVFLIIVLALLLIFFIAFLVYASIYYHADDSVLLSIENNDNALVDISYDKNNNLIFTPKNIDYSKGFIFYPGEKIEYKAYTSLMLKIAEKGILCILLKVNFNLAILDINSINGITDNYLNINDWYIGGHSLGGTASSIYIERHQEEFKGLILLASYPSVDLSSLNIKVLSLYGTCDSILNTKKYEENKKYLPESFYEYVITGGNHSNFGNYGLQEKDSLATITHDGQQKQTSEFIDYFINLND